MLTRRRLLFGRNNALRPAFATACLPARGVVCRSCGEACAAGAIAFRPAAGGVSRPALDSAACNACGDCVPVCPVGALSLVAVEIPEELPA